MEMKYTITPLESLINRVNIFRLAIVIVIIVLNGSFSIIDGTANVVLFYFWASFYFLLIAFFAVYTKLNLNEKFSLSYLNIIDIVMMSVFMYLSKNIAGFGILIIPFVAIASLLETDRYNLFYGSVATIAIMVCVTLQIYRDDISHDGSIYLFFQAGTLSAACLVISFVTSLLAQNLSTATEASLTKEEEIANLNRLNELVLQGLNDVVIVLDKYGDIRQYNAQAQNYFSFLKRGSYFDVFQPILNEWRATDEKLFLVDSRISDVQMSGRAISVDELGDKLLLLFLRSAEDLANESRKIKLESLGRLTANIAHEIRNPLSAIRQSNELLAESNDDEITHKFTGIVSKNVGRIDQLVEEVLTLNKRDRINPVEIHLPDFIFDFVNEFELAKPEARRRVRVKIDINDEVIVFDYGHLQQILWNLINNAWQHANKKSPVVVIYITQNNHLISLSVSDSGSGVNRAVLDKIFEPFFTTEKQGTGLGLYIARELALANGAYLDYLPQTKRFEMKFRVKTNEQ